MVSLSPRVEGSKTGGNRDKESEKKFKKDLKDTIFTPIFKDISGMSCLRKL